MSGAMVVVQPRQNQVAGADGKVWLASEEGKVSVLRAGGHARRRTERRHHLPPPYPRYTIPRELNTDQTAGRLCPIGIEPGGAVFRERLRHPPPAHLPPPRN